MKQLKEWFVSCQRDLPWRHGKTPYRVWVAEVMLQQTRAKTVIPYFHRWMERFPTLEALSNASLPEVMKLWEGLGYYSRARNLHKAAQLITQKYDGLLPSDPQTLTQLPGFGPYTVGAVLSFAFHKRGVAVDGNVIRVLSRYCASMQETRNRKFYEKITEAILPEKEPWIVMEGLIELGATVCQKKPNCSICPLNTHCLAFSQGTISQFPISKKRPPITHFYRQVAIILYQNTVLVREEKEVKLMQNLYEFPSYSIDQPLPFMSHIQQKWSLPLVQHRFTRYHGVLYPSVYCTDVQLEVPGYLWKQWEELNSIPFSSGHRKIVQMLREDPLFIDLCEEKRTIL